VHLYGGPYPFVQTGDVKHADLYLTSYSQTYSDAGLEQSKLWPQGTLCITIAANIAETAILGFDACFPDSVIGFVADESKCDPRFIKYKLDTIKQRYQQVSQGAAQDNLSLEKLLSFKLTVPSIEVQRRIADILSAYDDLIENNRRRMALLEEAARQLYREWFVRLRFPGYEHTSITTGVPQGWEKTTAISAMDVLSGGTPKTSVSDYWDGDIPFYTPKDATEACFVLDTERSITELGLKNCNSRLYAPDTVFISARGTVGKLNLVSRPMAMSQSCYALLGKGHVTQFFLFCELKEAIEHFKQHAVGAVFDAIVVDTFKLIPFTVPHEKIVRLFEETVTPMFREVANLMEQNQKLRAARDLLLPRLMSGEIAV
jgi:type I restriction enzyme S subunit